MINTKSISYFTDHNMLRQMPQELLYRLLSPYAAFFRQQEVILPPSWENDLELPLDAICIALMNVHTAETSSELIEELIMLQTLINSKELIEPRLDRLVSSRFSHRQELQRRDGEAEADFILKLWLDGTIRTELEKLVPWLQAKTAKVYAEYPLRESLCPPSEKNKLELLGLSGIMERVKIGQAQASERISAHFRSKGYTDFCEIKAYPCEENNEVVFIVDHGGKQQRVNTLTKEKKKDVTAYTPLLNDFVILMPERALMRVSTRMSWCEALYREVFGAMILQDQYAFEERVLYHFEPMFGKPPSQALALAGFHNFIKSVELKSITYSEPDENIGVYTRVDTEQKLMYAKHLQGGVPDTVQKVVLALNMKDRKAGRPVTVTIQRGKGKGIGCSVESYYPLVTRWLTNLGFRQGIPPSKTRRLLDEAAKENDLTRIWQQVARVLRKESVTMNYLEKVCGPRIRLFLEKYLNELSDAQKSHVWYESENEHYRILEQEDTFLIVEPDNIFNVFGEVRDIDEIVLYTIDKKALFEDIYKALCDRLRKAPALHGEALFGGSILASRGVSVWMFFPASAEDISHYEIIRANRLTYDHSCLILPRDKWNKSEDWFQRVYLDELLEIDTSGQLVLKCSLLDCVEDVSHTPQDGPPYRKWHLAFPQSRDWGHIDMRFGYDAEQNHTTIHITYGAGINAPQANLKHSDIPAFTKQTGNCGWKKEFELLLHLAGQMHQKGYFLRDSNMGAYLNRLANSLSEYFCIDGLFYEEAPNNDGAKKQYRLKFRTSVEPSLLQRTQVTAAVA